jgi:hypothetical protein
MVFVGHQLVRQGTRPVGRLGMFPDAPGRVPGTLLEIGNLEGTRVLALRHGNLTFETTSRGQRSTDAVFSSARDARRYMIMDPCGSFRFHTRAAPMVMKVLAPGHRTRGGAEGLSAELARGQATFTKSTGL